MVWISASLVKEVAFFVHIEDVNNYSFGPLVERYGTFFLTHHALFSESTNGNTMSISTVSVAQYKMFGANTPNHDLLDGASHPPQIYTE